MLLGDEGAVTGCEGLAEAHVAMSAPKQKEKAGEGADDLAAGFAELQSLSQSVMKEIDASGASKELAEVVAEFEALVQTGSDSYAAQRLLKKKASDLGAEAQKVRDRTAVMNRDGEESLSRKARLQSEIESVWAQVAEMHKREAEKRQKGDELKAQIQELNGSLSVGSGWSEEQEQKMKELQQQRSDVERDAEAKMSALSVLRVEVGHVHHELEKETAVNLEMEAEIEKLKGEVAEKVAATEANLAKKEREEKRLVALKDRVEVLTAEAAEKEAAVETGEREIATMEAALREAKGKMESYLRDYDKLFKRTHKLTEDLGEQMHHNQLAVVENTQREQDVQVRRAEVAQVAKDRI